MMIIIQKMNMDKKAMVEAILVMAMEVKKKTKKKKFKNYLYSL